MINVKEWVADISSKAYIDIYKLDPDGKNKPYGCVSLRESLEYAFKYNIPYSCYDSSSSEKKELCKFLNDLVGEDTLVASSDGIKQM